MAVCEIQAALLQAEKKGHLDSHYLCSGTFGSEWGCRFTFLCSDWSGSTETYRDKFLKVVFVPCSPSACIFKNLVLSAGKYTCAARGPFKGQHKRDFVLNSGPGCNSSSYAVSNSARGAEVTPADLLLKAPSS